jgi:D-sedoheptulose 7-phosphate isomerase
VNFINLFGITLFFLVGIKIITLSDKDGGEMKNLGDVNIVIPSNDTPRIQEMHIMTGHMICALIDDAF